MEIIEQLEESFWWDIAENCSYATFYHIPLWHRLASRSDTSNRDRSVGVVFANGTRGVVPLLQRSGLVKTQMSSTFAGCYGGLIADGPVDSEEAASLYRHILGRGGGSFKFISNPLKEDAGIKEFSEGEVEEDFTHILDLSRGFESLVADFSRGHRSSLKKGRRMGVTVRPAESVEDFEAYYGAYEASLERWGKDVSEGYSWKLFEEACELSDEYPTLVKLWLAEVDEKVASGALIFYWQRHASYWHGAAYKEFFDHRPNNVLHTTIIRDALDRGFDFYDFNPSGGYEGVAQFKARFGARKCPIKRRRYKKTMLHQLFG